MAPGPALLHVNFISTWDMISMRRRHHMIHALSIVCLSGSCKHLEKQAQRPLAYQLLLVYMLQSFPSVCARAVNAARWLCGTQLLMLRSIRLAHFCYENWW